MGQGGLKERESTRSLVERAKKHEIAGEFVEAAECYQQLIKRDPGDPSLFAALAGAVMRQGRLNDARAAFERAIELNPEQPAWVYQNLGNVYSELQAPDRALSVYQIALQRNKERNAELLYLGIGRSLRRLQRWTDASLAYQQAIEVRETTGGRSYGEDVYLELREALLREGNAASAARAYQHWLEQSYLINHTHQVIYCPIPKNACTFFKTVLVENSERRDEFKKSKKDAHVFTRQKDSGFRLTDVRYLERSDYCKFVILRNPFDRLVSAYANLFVQPLRQQQRVERIVQDVIKAIYVFEGAEPDFVKSVSFDQFVRYLIRTEDVDLNYHWRPQHTLLGYGLVNFDLIGQFENLSSVMQRLATKTGMRIQNRILNRTVYGSPVGSDSYHDLHPREFLKLEEFPRAQELVTSELAELIKDRYAKDIEIYKTAFDSDPSTSFSASRNV